MNVVRHTHIHFLEESSQWPEAGLLYIDANENYKALKRYRRDVNKIVALSASGMKRKSTGDAVYNIFDIHACIQIQVYGMRCCIKIISILLNLDRCCNKATVNILMCYGRLTLSN